MFYAWYCLARGFFISSLYAFKNQLLQTLYGRGGYILHYTSFGLHYLGNFDVAVFQP